MSTSKLTLSAAGVVAALLLAGAAAAVTQVNIQDPTITARVAHVDAGNRLAVQEVPPSTFFHGGYLGLGQGNGCVTIAAPPSGKALIVRQIRVDAVITSGGSPIVFFNNPSCSGSEIGSVTPATTGLSTETFDPGLAVPSGGVLTAVIISGSLGAEVYVDGYTVAASVAPLVGETFQMHGHPLRR